MEFLAIRKCFLQDSDGTTMSTWILHGSGNESKAASVMILGTALPMKNAQSFTLQSAG